MQLRHGVGGDRGAGCTSVVEKVQIAGFDGSARDIHPGGGIDRHIESPVHQIAAFNDGRPPGGDHVGEQPGINLCADSLELLA